MHDARTRQAIDALAELLLTGPQEPVQLDAQPVAESDPDLGAGLELAPGELIGSSSPRLRIADDPAPPAVIEAVLLGHLPGFASPWVSQYAADLAQRHQGAALLRIAESAVQIELFDVNPDLDRQRDRQPQTNPFEQDSDEPAGADELVETLHDLGAAYPGAGAYLLLIDRPTDPVQRQRLLAVDRWTVLTSANDAAVVGCYRMLKTLLAGADRHPRISLMFMGCDEAEAASAVERLNRAAAEFLSAPIGLGGVRRRMRPAPRRQAGRFQCPSPDKLWNAITQTIDLTPNTPQTPTAPEPIFTLEPKIESGITPPKPDAENLGEAETEASGYIPLGCEPDLPPVVRESAPSPPPPPAPEPPDPDPEPDDSSSESEEADNLAHHLTGLTALQARSPRHPQVQLAVDTAGRLHMLLQISAVGGGTDTTAALATLNAARSWLTEHRQLIALTAPDRKIDLDTAPQAHLLTDQPAAAAEFLFAAPPAERPFRLHLLTPVTVAGRTAWACAPVG